MGPGSGRDIHALAHSGIFDALTCAGAQAGVPPCAGDVEIGNAPIVRVEHNDVLILNDGRALHLEGIRLPHATQDRSPQGLEDQAYDALNTLAKNQDVAARAVWPKPRPLRPCPFAGLHPG